MTITFCMSATYLKALLVFFLLTTLVLDSTIEAPTSMASLRRKPNQFVNNSACLWVGKLNPMTSTAKKSAWPPPLFDTAVSVWNVTFQPHPLRYLRWRRSRAGRWAGLGSKPKVLEEGRVRESKTSIDFYHVPTR